MCIYCTHVAIILDFIIRISYLYCIFSLFFFLFFFFFFFQAEDGIRDLYVTGVQTCALPIYSSSSSASGSGPRMRRSVMPVPSAPSSNPGESAVSGSRCGSSSQAPGRVRSEERRVGKECRGRWSPDP